MTDFIEPLKTALVQFGWRDVFDISIMAVILYALIKILSKTRAMRVVIGLAVILLFAWIAELLNLATVTWLFSWILQASAVFIVILFQPEIRRALEKLGRGKIFGGLRASSGDSERLVEQFSRAVLNMAKHKVGAIIVFERKTGLAEVLESGTALDADVSSELIENIFYPNTPLHDGAMVVRDGRIAAAGCFLPLSDNKQIASELGTRHRASLGVSEVSDAYVIVVSEERGTISFAYDGTLRRHIDAKGLREILDGIYQPSEKGMKREKAPVDLSAQTKEIPIADIVEAEDLRKQAQEPSEEKEERK